MPHGHCYLWKPGLVYTHVISDLLIGLAYFSISLTLYSLVKKIKLPFSAVALSFGVFIGACGLTHLMEIWNLWNADYWYGAWLKVMTAIASVTTGIYLYRLRHPIYLFAEAAKLSEKRRIDLEVLTTELGKRVDERTSELQESEARFRQITEFLPQMVWTTDHEGNHLFFNDRWYEYTGMSPGQGHGWGWQHILHPDDLERTDKFWRHSLQTGEPYNIEYRLKNKDQDYRWHLGQAAPLRNSKGEISQWFGSCTDIEDQKQIQIVLKDAIQARDNFLSIASHELNTPLTSLKLQAQLQEKKLTMDGHIKPEDSRKFIGIVTRQTDRLSHLVNDMLDVSRVQSGKLTLQFEECNLARLIKDVADRFSSEGLVVNIQSSTVPALQVDTFRIEQVLVNIFTNARKYAPGSEVLIKIEPVKNHFVRVEIRDKGPGIEKENLKKIFSRFERGISANEVSGLGLGLYISQQIIEAHKGRIWAESEFGKGSAFIFEIPVTKV